MTFEQWYKDHTSDFDDPPEWRARWLAECSWNAALHSSDTVIERKVKARDVHYKLIELYGLWSTPPDNEAVRRLLEQLAGVES